MKLGRGATGHNSLMVRMRKLALALFLVRFSQLNGANCHYPINELHVAKFVQDFPTRKNATLRFANWHLTLLAV